MTAASCSTSRKRPHLPLLALDIGKKHIGVAVCDRMGLSCHGIARLKRQSRHWPRQVMDIAERYGCGGIVVGLALNMDGSEGAQAADCRSAAQALGRHGALPVLLWDERLSTWSARERLRACGLSEAKVAERVDQTAAAIILEDFLAAHPELTHA